MSERPKFDGFEYIAIFMALQKQGFSKDFRAKLLNKLTKNTSFRSAGRPTKKPNYSVDARRAKVIEHLKEEWPEDNDQELIALAQALAQVKRRFEDKKIPPKILRQFPKEFLSLAAEPSALTELFRESADLSASVSRGKKILRDEE